MSPSGGDRIAVPTNGHRARATDSEVDAHLAEATDLGATTAADEAADAPEPPVVVSTPPVSRTALAAGFGVVAAIVVLLLGRRLGRRD
jgi:hypothetical protein